jgi:hypothetical protein
VDIFFNPSVMRFNIGSRESDQLYSTSLEFVLSLDETRNLGGTNGGEIARMRKQNCPALIDIGIEVERLWACGRSVFPNWCGGFGIEVWCW